MELRMMTSDFGKIEGAVVTSLDLFDVCLLLKVHRFNGDCLPPLKSLRGEMARCPPPPVTPARPGNGRQQVGESLPLAPRFDRTPLTFESLKSAWRTVAGHQQGG